jgi:hypothetical protein
MLINKQSISNKIIYLIFFLVAFTVCLRSSYSPFSFRRLHVDSSVYITIAQGIIKGMLPYRDLVDNKGPFVYFMSIPGLFLGGFTGVWITELLLIFVSVIFAWKTAIFFGDKNKALLGTVFSFAALIPVNEVSAGTEEYSLPFLFISLYLFTKHYFSPKKIMFFELTALGICFSCAILTRLNMFPLWAGFCLVILFESVFKRQYLQLLKYICAFLTGVITVFIPVFLYLRLNGIVYDCWNLVVMGGAAKGFSFSGLKDIVKNFYVLLNKNYSFLPLFFGILYIMKYFRRDMFTYYIGFSVSYFLMILFHSFSWGGNHYNTVFVPFFPAALTVLIDKLDFNFFRENIRKTALFIFLCIVFSEGFAVLLFNMNRNFYYENDSGAMLIKAGKMLDENTKDGDKIISLGYDGYIYPFTKRNAASKYFYQGSGIDFINGAREEFISEILSVKPAIIVIAAFYGNYQYLENWHKPVYEMMEREYYLLSRENGFIFYKRNP